MTAVPAQNTLVSLDAYRHPRPNTYVDVRSLALSERSHFGSSSRCDTLARCTNSNLSHGRLPHTRSGT